MFKKIVALIAVGFGAFFTVAMISGVWSNSFENYNKIVPTAGMISVASIALLVVLKLVEEKK